MKAAIGILMALTACRAASAGTSATFTAEIKKILGSAGSKVAVSLRDPEGNETVDIGGDTALAPASIAKTVSTYCSLNVLGPQFQFDTLFGMTGKVQGDTLEGDLVIQGSGDPSLVIEDLREIVEKLRFVHGIRKINGNLVFDVSYLGQRGLSIADGFEGDEGRSFTAEITPAAMNQNSFSFWVTPDVRDPAKARVVTLPANVMDVQLVNKVKVATSTEVNVSFDPHAMQATAHGVIARDGDPKGIYRAADDSYDYARNLLQRLWTDAGGEWKKPEIKISNTPVKFTLLWRNSSRPLAKIMMDVNKLSLNLGAEMIFLAAGAEKYGRPASYEKSLKMLNECLTERNIKSGGILLTNGSGLSREARIKVAALSQFLHGALSGVYAPEYLATFGLLGIDGTSKGRLKSFAGRARLKTGSLKDVRSIAGYLYSRDHKPYAFAMIQNGVNAATAKGLEDRVIETFLRDF